MRKKPPHLYIYNNVNNQLNKLTLSKTEKNCPVTTKFYNIYIPPVNNDFPHPLQS